MVWLGSNGNLFYNNTIMNLSSVIKLNTGDSFFVF